MNNMVNINKIVIWGLKHRYHTHRHIFQAFYKNAKKSGYKVIWVEDSKRNAGVIESGDLVLTADVNGKMVKEKVIFADYNLPIVKGVYYCCYNCKDCFTEKIERNYLINLQVYTTEYADKADQKWGVATLFDTKTRTLFQPWGTDLLAEEFKEPVYNKGRNVFWVGSVWNDKNNYGNIEQINEFKSVFKNNNLKFIQIRFVPDWLNIFFVRLSRLAPAISGKHQVKVNYLPCRMFKNISYGQLGISNVKKFNEIFADCNIYDNDLDKMIKKALSLSKQEYVELVKKQQDICKNFTYKQALENIIKAFCS